MRSGLITVSKGLLPLCQTRCMTAGPWPLPRLRLFSLSARVVKKSSDRKKNNGVSKGQGKISLQGEDWDSQNCSSLCGRCAAAFRAAWQKFASYNGNNPRNLLTKPVGFTASNRFHKYFWICWTIWLWNEFLQAVCWVHVGCHVGPATELRLLYTTGWTE